MGKNCSDMKQLPLSDTIRIVFCDLDGTITREDNTISNTMTHMIPYLNECGIMFIPCTGRSYCDMRTCFSNDIRFPAICLNGALFCDDYGEAMILQAFTSKQIKTLALQLIQNDLPVVMFAKDKVYCYGNIAMLQSCVETCFHSEELLYTGELCMIQDIDDLHDDILKVETLCLDQKKKEDCKKRLQCLDAYLVSSSLPFNIEITQKGVHKASMVKQVLHAYGLTPHQALIFGDSDNDFQLFEQFPYCIAVENASDHIKEKAVFVIGSCEEDGVGLFLDSYLKQRS